MARNHHHEFAVIGLGRFGASLALTLMRNGYTVLGIDRDPEIVQRLADAITQTVALDSTDEEALRAVGVMSFDTVVVAIGTSFEANLLTTVALKSLGVRRVICKALTERQRDILLKIGADRVILPEYEAGQRLAEELSVPGMVDHMILGGEHCVTEMRAPEALVGRTLRQADLRGKHALTLLAVKTDDRLIALPPAEYTFAAGDLLVLVGRTADLHAFSDAEAAG